MVVLHFERACQCHEMDVLAVRGPTTGGTICWNSGGEDGENAKTELIIV